MTRETKIGLLVGLAFIIVIGILLSDHLTTRGELPAAQLTQVGDSVRVANTVPLSTNPPLTPVTVPNNVAPTNVVATHDELNTVPATSVVQIGPSNPGLIAVTPPAEPARTVTPYKNDHLLIADATAPAATPDSTPATAPADPLANDPLMKKATPNQTTPAQPEPAAKNLKPIKAEKGDTVSRLAAKYLGANTTTNRQAIIDANPTLKSDPAKIIIGHTYLIPTKPIEANALVAKAVEPPSIPDTVPYSSSSKPEAKSEEAKSEPKAVAKNADKAPKSTSTYTVKSNDTLWKIANGDPAVVKELEALNKDVLKGKGILHPGLVLKVPAKTAVAAR